MASHSYGPPLEKLLNLGHPDQLDWPAEFQTLGLKREHVPDLIRMAVDEELNNADAESDEVWAPLYAWRALGELRAVEAVKPLLSLLERIDEYDDDWVDMDLPDVFAKIGPAAIPDLKEYLNNTANLPYGRVAAANCLETMANDHPEVRDECVAILSGQLEHFRDEEDFVNGLLISSLVELEAVEAASVMRQAFEAGCVDETILGDWEEVQIDLGLKTEQDHPQRPLELLDLRSVHKQAKQERSKQKKQKKARKQKKRK